MYCCYDPKCPIAGNDSTPYKTRHFNKFFIHKLIEKRRIQKKFNIPYKLENVEKSKIKFYNCKTKL